MFTLFSLMRNGAGEFEKILKGETPAAPIGL